MTRLILFLQFISIILISMGIYFEIDNSASEGFIFITVGSFLFGLFTKIREIQLQIQNHNLKRKVWCNNVQDDLQINLPSIQADFAPISVESD